MPEVTITFDLPDEEWNYKQCNQAIEMSLALEDIRSELRKYNKYGHQFTSTEDAIEKIYQFVLNTINDRNIDLE